MKENFNSKEYRNNLAKDLKDVRKKDRKLAEKNLDVEKNTTIYEESKKIHQHEIEEKVFDKKVISFEKEIKELSKSENKDTVFKKMEELKLFKENNFPVEAKLKKASEKIIFILRPVIEGRDSFGSWRIKDQIKNIFGEKTSPEIISNVVNSKEVKEFLADSVYKKIENIFYFLEIGSIIPYEIINSSEIKNAAREFVKNNNEKPVYHSSQYEMYYKNERLISLFGLSKELNYSLLTHMIKHASYSTFQTGAAITYDTALSLAKGLPKEYIAENLRTAGVKIFSYGFGGNSGGSIYMDIALDCMKTFQLSKEDILPVVENFIDRKIWGDWDSPDVGLEALKEIKFLGVSKEDFSQGFINSIKNRITEAVKNDRFNLAEELQEAVLPEIIQ